MSDGKKYSNLRIIRQFGMGDNVVSKNFFGFVFILCLGISLWTGGQFLYQTYGYFHRSQSAPARLSNWEVLEKKEGKFSIEVTYEFWEKGAIRTGRFLFPKPTYSNPYVAEDLVEEWKEESWTVWYNPKQPTDVTFQKRFPLKEGAYFLISLGVILYFAILKMYLSRHSFEAEREREGK